MELGGIIMFFLAECWQNAFRMGICYCITTMLRDRSLSDCDQCMLSNLYTCQALLPTTCASTSTFGGAISLPSLIQILIKQIPM